MRAKAGVVGDFLWRHGDAMFVVVIAFGVAILEIFGVPSEGVIDAAILATLGTVAIVLFRDRLDRGSTKALEQLASDAISDRPFQVVSQLKEWNLVGRDHAVITKTEEIRFTRNDVATKAEWDDSDGSVEEAVGRWRRDDAMPWIDAEVVHDFRVRGGIKTIYCFNEEHSRGDTLEWQTEVKAFRRFSEPHESVSLMASTKADHPRTLRLVWPENFPPSRVEIRHGSNPATKLQVRRKNGRSYVEEKIAVIPVGEKVKIEWTW
jgi:hypothetical protein